MKNYPRYFLTTILIFGTLLADLSTAIAETKKADFTIDSNAVSSYRSLMQQAEDRAERAIATEFANNPELTEITVTILGERQNRIAPLLLVKVSRSQWEEQPEMEKWTRYFTTSEVLLGFGETKTPQSSPPPPPPPSPTTPTDSPPSSPQTTPDTSEESAPSPSSPTDTSPSTVEERERRLEQDPAFRDD